MLSITNKSAEYGTFSSSDVPRCLLNSKVVIAGGGPAGLFTAVSLHTAGVSNITVLERENHDTQFDPQRSYIFALGERGRVAASKVPGLLEHLFKYTPTPDGYGRCVVKADGSGPTTAKATSLSSFLKNFTPGTVYFRPRYMTAYVEYINEHCSDIELIQNSKIDNVTFSNDNGGTSTIHYTHTDDDGNSEGCSIDANMLIACDGVNSAVVEGLKKAEPSVVQSPHGFEATFFPNQTSKYKARSLILGHDIFANADGAPDDLALSYWIEIEGENKKLRTFIFPLLKEDCEQIGGFLTTIAALKDDPMWELQSIEEAYKYFEKQFPGLDIRANISEESLQMFIDGRSVTFPIIRHRHSMGAKVGDQGGVVILGDAAHAVPPDIGQGLNSSVEDVDVMMTCATELPSDATSGDLAYLFHEKRIADIKAMTELAVYGGFRNKPTWMLPIVFGDFMLRNALNERFPSLFDPPYYVLVTRTTPYSEVVRRQRVMTYKLFVILFIFAALIWLGIKYLFPQISKIVGGFFSSSSN